MNCVSTWRNTAHAHVGSQCSKFANFGENSRESCALLAIPHDSNKSEPRKPDPCDPAEHAETLSLGGIKAWGRKRMSALHGSTQLVSPPGVHRSRLPRAHDSPAFASPTLASPVRSHRLRSCHLCSPACTTLHISTHSHSHPRPTCQKNKTNNAGEGRRG